MTLINSCINNYTLLEKSNNMPEDKRIKKTKKALKDALIELLAEKQFEQITVKEICSVSYVSRITFYAHYDDKFELAEDIFNDMINIAAEDYRRLQKLNNPEHKAILSYCNLLDCILNLYYDNFSLFSRTISEANPYINAAFFKLVRDYVKYRVERESKTLTPKYSLPKITGFITYGLWGFITASHAEKCSIDTIRKEAKEVLKSLLNSEVLTVNNK